MTKELIEATHWGHMIYKAQSYVRHETRDQGRGIKVLYMLFLETGEVEKNE